VREVDDPRAPVLQHQAEAEQPVHRPGGQAEEQELDVGHGDVSAVASVSPSSLRTLGMTSLAKASMFSLAWFSAIEPTARLTPSVPKPSSVPSVAIRSAT